MTVDGTSTRPSSIRSRRRGAYSALIAARPLVRITAARTRRRPQHEGPLLRFPPTERSHYVTAAACARWSHPNTSGGQSRIGGRRNQCQSGGGVMGVVKWYKRDPNAALTGMASLTLKERGAYRSDRR